jgi:hypothetical protein
VVVSPTRERFAHDALDVSTMRLIDKRQMLQRPLNDPKPLS